MDAEGVSLTDEAHAYVSDKEKVLTRPDAYIGSVEPTTRVVTRARVREATPDEISANLQKCARRPRARAPDAACYMVTVKGASKQPEGIAVAAEDREKLPEFLEATEELADSPRGMLRFPLPEWLAVGVDVWYSELTFPEALEKLFDEVVQNAADRRFRDRMLSTISVNISPLEIAVANDGSGMPVEMRTLRTEHHEAEMWLPTQVFSIFNFTSNADDEERRFTTGRNGVGAKATNVWSSRFEVHVADPDSKQEFMQTWENNMSTASEPRVRAFRKRRGFVSCRFALDFARLGMDPAVGLPEALVEMLTARAVELAALLPKKIKVNGKQIPPGFDAHAERLIRADLCYAEHGPTEAPPGTEATVSPIPLHARTPDLDFPTLEGVLYAAPQFQRRFPAPPASIWCNMSRCANGTHRSAVEDQLLEGLRPALRRAAKLKTGDDETLARLMPRADLLGSFRMILSCFVYNPRFDSQTKQRMTVHPREFPWSAASAVNARVQSQLMEAVRAQMLANVRMREGRQIAKAVAGSTRQSSLLSDIGSRYRPARLAGRGPGNSLILVEGLSALSSVVTGTEGLRDKLGAYALRGKIPNAFETSPKELTKNTEIRDLTRILHLDWSTGTSEDLAYDSVIIFTDQDDDGFHIAGLIMAFFMRYFPTLLAANPRFIKRFATPRIKAWPKGGHKRDAVCFFSDEDFRRWRSDENAGWNVKFYKGLGSSSAEEARAYFANIDKHLVDIDMAAPGTEEMLRMLFVNAKSADRRRYLAEEYDPAATVDYSLAVTPAPEYLRGETAHYLAEANRRKIPSAFSGLIEVYAKIMSVFFLPSVPGFADPVRRAPFIEAKIPEIGATVTKHMSYHHGEASLNAAICSLAQQYAGGNNLPLLRPEGQTGTRLFGGDDAAQPRYVYTGLHRLASVYPPEDWPVLERTVVDGKPAELQLVPLIPMALVNGVRGGIGNGWACNCLPHNPQDLIVVCKQIAAGNDSWTEPTPWAVGWKGRLEPDGKNWVSHGVFELEGDVLSITELPLNAWTVPWIERYIKPRVAESSRSMESRMRAVEADLRKILSPLKRTRAAALPVPLIREFLEDNNTATGVSMRFRIWPAVLEAIGGPENLEAFLGLSARHKVNLNFFRGPRVHPYESIRDLITDHAEARLDCYGRRKAFLLEELQEKAAVADSKARFIRMVAVERTLELRERPRAEVIEELAGVSPPLHRGSDYDYLLAMQMRSMTAERIAQLEREAEAAASAHGELLAISEREMWLAELERFEALWGECYAEWLGSRRSRKRTR